MNINIIDLSIGLIIEILSKVSYDSPMFNLLYSNKYLYSILEDYYTTVSRFIEPRVNRDTIVSRLIEPRINYLISCINRSKRCVVVVDDLIPFVNMILTKFRNSDIDIMLRPKQNELIINMILLLFNIHSEIFDSNIGFPDKFEYNTFLRRGFINSDYISFNDTLLISLGQSNNISHGYNRYLYITNSTHRNFSIIPNSKYKIGDYENVDFVVNLQGINSYGKNIESSGIRQMLSLYKLVRTMRRLL